MPTLVTKSQSKMKSLDAISGRSNSKELCASFQLYPIHIIYHPFKLYHKKENEKNHDRRRSALV
jgi:hypothetical protein